MTAPYYADDAVTLYHGDFREILPTLDLAPDLLIADPPYGETALDWDRWPDGWPAIAAQHAKSMWCFGSMRMFLDRRDEFADWKFAQDVVWEKHNGSGPGLSDRFYRVHEFALHWYQGPWSEVHHETPRVTSDRRSGSKTWKSSGREQADRAAHRGAIGPRAGYEDDGTRLQRSVIAARTMQGRAINETEKPEQLVQPLVEHGSPGGGSRHRRVLRLRSHRDGRQDDRPSGSPVRASRGPVRSICRTSLLRPSAGRCYRVSTPCHKPAPENTFYQ